mmetsp:Transcript_130304/g.376963  ORF Transcript_130304/g.376963 Transcript_130304/m.376963 type:complete len:206 (-) Transcript_130304:440-1057(-)
MLETSALLEAAGRWRLAPPSVAHGPKQVGRRVLDLVALLFQHLQDGQRSLAVSAAQVSERVAGAVVQPLHEPLVAWRLERGAHPRHRQASCCGRVVEGRGSSALSASSVRRCALHVRRGVINRRALGLELRHDSLRHLRRQLSQRLLRLLIQRLLRTAHLPSAPHAHDGRAAHAAALVPEVSDRAHDIGRRVAHGPSFHVQHLQD